MGGLFIELWYMKKWIVYVHIFPNGKLYFGITSKKPNARWESGNGYSDNQPVMKSAIIKYGWDNIEHKILFEGLSYKEATEKEIELIATHKTNCRRYGAQYGYNMTDGGEGTLGHVCSEETKIKMSQNKIGKNKGIDNYKSKPVICDDGYWETISDFCKEYGYTRRTVEKWLYGLSAMPCEWYDKKLRLANEMHNIKRQNKRWQNTIYYDGMTFKSQAAFARYIGKYPADVFRWIKNDNVPQEYIKKGFSVNKSVND